MLIDLGPDAVNACMEYNVDISAIKYILQTHAYSDHFDAGHLITRHKDYACENVKHITFVSSFKTMEAINRKLKTLKLIYLIQNAKNLYFYL